MRAVSMINKTAVHIASISMDHWIIRYGIPDYFLTDDGSKFLSKFFESLCAFLGKKHLTITVHHPQTNGQV